MKKLLLLLTIFLITYSDGLQAQTPYVINQNTNKGWGGDNAGMGSSFLTIGAGYLDSIEVIIRTGSYTSRDFYVYDGNTNNVASQIHHEVVTGIPTGSQISYMIRLTSNIFLNAASTYTFMLHNAPLRFGTTNDYADGALWTGAGFLTAGEHTDRDLDFVAYIGAAPVTSVSEPTGKENTWVSYLSEERILKLNNFQAEEIKVFNSQGKEIASGNGNYVIINSVTEGVYIITARKGKEVYSYKYYLKP